MKHYYAQNLRPVRSLLIVLFFLLGSHLASSQTFSQSNLDFNGFSSTSLATSLTFGPDGRLYVSEYTGRVKVYTIERVSSSNYRVIASETLVDVRTIQDHDDDGTLSGTTAAHNRETTGLAVAGTAANPVIYVASSDFRIGGGSAGGSGDRGLDTNSGIITRFTWNGSNWDVVDLVRGLPRSEENHATNGLEFVTVNGTDYLIVAQGGHTNAGAPSTNFAWTGEYALSAAVLSINLTQLAALPILDDNGRSYIYDLPTLDDPTRANANGIEDPDTPGYDGVDMNDPFGGNDGLNQAMVVAGGPVQIFSPGYRNTYDLVVTESGGVYVTDNGANGGWGGFPSNEGGGSATNDYDPLEPGSSSSSGGEQINNKDHLQLVTTDIQNYAFGSYYGGHPNPTRANPSGAGIWYNPSPSSTAGAVFRTQVYDPDGSTPGSTTDPALGLPANWPPLPLAQANPVEGDYRGPGDPNPVGPPAAGNVEGPVDGELTLWGNNTNGIDEYTASNFGGAMQGDLIAGVNTGVLRRVELNPDGSLETLTSSFASGLGGNALGITCNSDTDPFPGSIWVGKLSSTNAITILEPQDFIECLEPGDPGYDPNGDNDSDGYTNQDEEDNGTDPCNGASQPEDFDKIAGAPFDSDLNDDDDDNDGIMDAHDPMQLGDPTNGGSDAFAIPIENELFSDTSLGGYLGLGLTGLMNNGDANPNWLNWLDDRDAGPNPNDILGGAIGAMTMQMTSGTALGSANDQEKGFQYGINVDQTMAPFTVEAGMANFNNPLQLYGNAAPVNGELGIFIGDGTQSNYIKFIITPAGLQALQETGDIAQTPLDVPITVGNRPGSSVIFYMEVNPATGEVALSYAFDNGTRTNIGSIVAEGSILQAIQQANTPLMVGMTGTSNSPTEEVEGTWEFLNVINGIPTITDPLTNITVTIGPGNTVNNTVINLDDFFDDNDGVANLTYTVESNTDPAIDASISGNMLTLMYPTVPATSDITIRATDVNTQSVAQTFTVTVSETTDTVLYRVNSAGPTIPAIDGGLDWGIDTQNNNSIYLVEAAADRAGSFPITNFDASINLGTTPTAIFDTERFDTAAGAPNMHYSFPTIENGNYEVRLYMANGFSGTSQPGQRVFDVDIEGLIYPLLNDIDLSATYGHATGTVVTHIVKVTDGSLDITFLHDVIENPLVNGIEILRVSDADLPIYEAPIANQINFTGEQLDGSLGAVALGGDGNLVYSISGVPSGITIDPTNGQIGGSFVTADAANSPYNVVVTIDDGDANTSDAITIEFEWTVIEANTLRINAGGILVTAEDGETNWLNNEDEDEVITSQYSVNTGERTVISNILYANRDASIPAYIDEATFTSLFSTERYDPITGDEMEFQIPLENGFYQVNLYVANSFAGTAQEGDRVYDILLEGTTVEDNFDMITRFGHEVAGVVSHTVFVSDGVLNLGFSREVENPLINAIEVVFLDIPPVAADPIADQTNEVGNIIEGNDITVIASGGDPQDAFTYALTGQPNGITIDASTGEITGRIADDAITGGPNMDGIHNALLTVSKPDMPVAEVAFNWTVTGTPWTDKNEDETYTPRHENSFVQAGDKFYLMGGRENAKTIDVYDYTNNSWTALTNSAPEEFNHFQATEYQGLIWVIGSFRTNNFPSEVPTEFIWAFDPANNEWIQGPEIPEGRRRGSSGLALYNDKFYIVAGNNDGHDGGFVPWFDEYDPATGTWTVLTDAPRARDHFHAAVIGDKLYAAGGRLSGGTGGVFAPTVSEVDVYDFTSGTWSTLPSDQNIPTERAGTATVNFNDKLIVIGGETKDSLSAFDTTESFDPATGEWSRLDDLVHARQGMQAIVSGNGIFVLGGSPNRGGGNQKNLEYLGEDNPVGNPSVASTVSAPSEVVIDETLIADIALDVTGGNVGVIITSMELSGADAADFAIVSGELTQSLLVSDTSHLIGIQLNDGSTNKSAILTINYGNGSMLSVDLVFGTEVPELDNPNTQNNREGDVVSLPIIATDNSGTPLTYSATNLPLGLTINEQTGLISGTITDSQSTDGPFMEDNGLVIIQAESGDVVDDWTEMNIGGANGITGGTNHFNDRNGGTIPYEITITTPGVYRFNWRSLFMGSVNTDENDSWLRFPNNNDVWFFGLQNAPANEASIISNLMGSQNDVVFPKGSNRVTSATTPMGAGGDGFFKIFRSGGTSQVYNWQALTSDNDGHNIYVWFVNPGTYTMEISERSAGHTIDKIAMYKVDGQSYTNSQLTAAPESSTNQNVTGGAANSPYNVEVTVENGRTPPGTASVSFIWNVDDNTANNGVIWMEDFEDLSDGTTIDTGDTAWTSSRDAGTFEVQNNAFLTAGNSNNPGVWTSEIINISGPVSISIDVDDLGGTSKENADFLNAFYSVDGGTPIQFGGVVNDISPQTFTVENITGSTIQIIVESLVSADAEMYRFDNVTLTGELNNNEAPVAIASATPRTGATPLEVNFTGSNSTDDVGVSNYAWNFGDGNGATIADPVHTYTAAGTYEAMLTVTDGEGLQNTTTVTIIVNDANTDTVTSFTLVNGTADVDLFELTEGMQISVADIQGIGLNIRANTDPAAVGSVSLVLSGPLNNTRTENVAPYALFGDSAGNYAGVAFPIGDYTMTATTYSAAGLGGTQGGTLTIQFSVVEEPNQAPVAVAEATPLTGDAPLEVNFTGSNSTDDVGIVTYAWDFGNGDVSADADPIYTYAQAGTYTASLTVTDDEGLQDTASLTIEVQVANETPVAIAEATPLTGTAPLEVNFTGSNSTDDVGIVTYAWDFGNGDVSADADPTYTYTQAGTYVASLTVTDVEGLEDTTSLTIEVDAANGAPVAIADATPLTGTAPLEVNFTGSNSTDDVGVVTYAWDFGNGDVSTDADPTYTYTQAGTYTASLTVTDAGGLEDTTSLTIEVDAANGAPLAFVTATPTTGTAPLLVNFTGNMSIDDVGIVSYAWDFGDGDTSTEIDPTHTYTAAGMYVATLTVTDGAGLEDSDSVTITVTNPVQDGVTSFTLVDANSNADVLTLNNNMEIDNASVQGMLLNIRANTIPTSVGSVSLAITGPLNVTRTENVAPYALLGDNAGNYAGIAFPLGNYTMTATSYSGASLSGTAGTPLTIQFSIIEPVVNQPPMALATATPLSGSAPLEVNFTGSSSTDDNGISSYAWDFGNGDSSTMADPIYTYNSVGTYTATLTVTDGEGLNDTSAVTIEVTDPMINQPPTAIASATPLTGTVPLLVNFTGDASTDDAGVTSYAWDFGDGSMSTLANPSHTYTQVGTYQASLTVMDVEGLTNSTTVTITVAPVIPDNSIVRLVVVNADTDTDMFELVDGMQIDNAAIQGINISVRAETNPSIIGSVLFVLGGELAKIRAESGAPYALYGDNAGNYFGAMFPIGNYTLDVTPYSGSGLTGDQGPQLNIQFSVVDQNVARSPIDNDNSDELSGLGNGPLAQQVAMQLYPNPSVSVASLRILDPSIQLTEVSVYDITGRLVSSYDADSIGVSNGLYQINVAALDDGVYFINARTASSNVFKQQLIVKK